MSAADALGKQFHIVHDAVSGGHITANLPETARAVLSAAHANPGWRIPAMTRAVLESHYLHHH